MTGLGRGQDPEHRFSCTAGEEGRRKFKTPFSPWPLSQPMMAWSGVFLGVLILLSAFPGCSVGGRAMPKLAERKLCADEECSCKSWGRGEVGGLGRQPVWRVLSLPSVPSPDPISMAVALQDYVAPDCRFLTIHRGQVVYVFSKLKGRGRLFWGGSVSFG